MFILKQKYGKIISGDVMKKVLLLIPLSLLLFGCKKKKEDPLKYEINARGNFTAVLEEGSTVKSVKIPNKHNDKDVTEISGFRNNSYIETVSFGSNITTIDPGTFTFCEHLKKINVTNNEKYKSIDGNLYDSKSLLIYASGKTSETFETDYNISEKAFTIAPNLKKIKANGSSVSANAFVFLENIEEIYIGSSTSFSENFILGIMPKKLIVNNKTILNDVKVDEIKEVYVIKNGIVSENFLNNYTYKNDVTLDKETYSLYEVK